MNSLLLHNVDIINGTEVFLHSSLIMMVEHHQLVVIRQPGGEWITPFIQSLRGHFLETRTRMMVVV